MSRVKGVRYQRRKRKKNGWQSVANTLECMYCMAIAQMKSIRNGGKRFFFLLLLCPLYLNQIPYNWKFSRPDTTSQSTTKQENASQNDKTEYNWRDKGFFFLFLAEHKSSSRRERREFDAIRNIKATERVETAGYTENKRNKIFKKIESEHFQSGQKKAKETRKKIEFKYKKSENYFQWISMHSQDVCTYC